MGICSSCLGQDRQDGSSDEDESSRLIFDDPTYYGTCDSEVLQDPQKEMEALQEMVAMISSRLLDVFALKPQASQGGPSTSYTARDARLSRFEDALAKLLAEPDLRERVMPTAASVSVEGNGWMVNGETNANGFVKVSNSEELGPLLLGGFAGIEPIRN